MKYELIVSDLDGTLLTEDMTVSRENEEAIKKISEMGILFTASSGRTLYEIPECVRKNPNIRYIAYSNGTAIFDKAEGRDIAENRITRAATNAAYDVLRDYDVLCSVHADGHAYVNTSSINDESCKVYQINEYYKSILLGAKRTESVEALARSSDGTEAVVIFFSRDEEIEPCRERLEGIDGLFVTSSIAHNIEICSRNAGKGEAFEILRKHLGIDREKTIAVGDNMNDTSMFDVAGLSLCAGNGSDEAKARADRVICRSDEHTASYIYNEILK